MKKFLVVTTHTDIEDRLIKMIARGEIPQAEYSVIVEFFESTPYIPKVFTNFFTIDDLRNREAIAAAKDKALSWGPFDQILATDEYAIYLAAELREFLGVDGMQPHEAVKFRDKVAMKEVLAGSAVRIPKLYEAAFLLGHSELFPIVAKPRSFAGSKGVEILKTVTDLKVLLAKISDASLSQQTFREFDLCDLEFEEFIGGSIFHIDGLALDGEIKFCRASEYLGNCLAYLNGAPLGSLSVSDEEENVLWQEFAAKVIKVMQVPNGAFHLEAFLNDEDERVFLEIGIRPGGSLIVPAIRNSNQLDLDVAHLQCQLGIQPAVPAATSKQFGWLIFAKETKSEQGSRVKFIEAPVLSELETLSWHDFPAIGESAQGTSSYTDTLGSFVFNSAHRHKIFSNMGTLLKNYRVLRG